MNTKTWEFDKQQNEQTEALILQIKERAGNLYLTRQLLCTEAVVVTLNKGLDGGLSDAQAIAVSAPFCIALGESGCICGALSGAILGCGLILGKGSSHLQRKSMRESAKQLHDRFKSIHGSTCCRVLSRRVKHDENVHFQQCAKLTAGAAEMAVRLVLDKKPELVYCEDRKFLGRRDSRIGGALKRLLQSVFCL